MTVPEPRTAQQPRLVLCLGDLRRADLALAGGKGANLGELMSAGFPVPEGFVVSTEAYDSVVELAGLAATILDGASGGGRDIRSAIGSVEIPPTIAGPIRTAYEALGGGPVAVRSSATAEDLVQAAFAGQHDTNLNVVGETELLDAVRRCWGSLFTERAMGYRRHRGLDSADVRIAVVVQQMVDAEFAGVAFTANPVTGARDEVVIDATPGLGEAVVSGQVTPDHVVIGPDGAVRERRPGRREVVIHSVAAEGVAAAGHAHPDAPGLPDAVLADLAALGRDVGQHFGSPQDVEWAYADEQLWLVQARPMTALPPPPLGLNRIQRAIGLQLLDYFSVRPYPLDVTAWFQPGIGRMVQRMLAELAGLHLDLDQMLPERDGVVVRFVPLVPRPTRATLSAPLRVARRAQRYDPAALTEDPRFRAFDRTARELAAVQPDLLRWRQLFEVVDRALAACDVVTDLRVDYLARTGVALLRLRAALALLRRSQLFALLTVGGRTRTADANDALAALAALVRSSAPLAAAFAELDPSALAARLDDDADAAPDAESTVFRAELAGFLAEYGHRETLSPLVMTAPTWADDPTPVLALVKVLAQERLPATEGTAAARTERRFLEHPLLRGRRRRAAALRLVAAARAGVALREDTHFHATRVLPVLRRVLLEAGRRLAAAQVLSSAEDVFHLRLSEVERLAEPEQLTPAEAERLRSLVSARAARRSELSGVAMFSPADLGSVGAAPEGAVLVTGVPASGGRASGPVRVIREPAQFGTLRPGDVLVCPYTNPAWTPLFQRAAAVVVDSGGLGSHAAIVAREYGIPAVMGTVTGTDVLPERQSVMVDGDTGTVATTDAMGQDTRATGACIGQPTDTTSMS